jgi:hypothetical protein
LDLRYFEKEFCDIDVRKELDKLQDAASIVDPGDIFDSGALNWSSGACQREDEDDSFAPQDRALHDKGATTAVDDLGSMGNRSPSSSACGISTRESMLSGIGHPSSQTDLTFEAAGPESWLEPGRCLAGPTSSSGASRESLEQPIGTRRPGLNLGEDLLCLDRHSVILSPAPSLDFSRFGTPRLRYAVANANDPCEDRLNGALTPATALSRSTWSLRTTSVSPAYSTATVASCLVLPPGVERIGQGIGFTPKKQAAVDNTPSTGIARLVSTPKKLFNRLRGGTPMATSTSFQGQVSPHGRRRISLTREVSPEDTHNRDMEAIAREALSWGTVRTERALGGVDETPSRPPRTKSRFPRLTSLALTTPRRPTDGAVDGARDLNSTVRLVSTPHFRVVV